ncbi:peptidoglycan-binding protein [Lysobacter antibioticus]|uniref:peptidoglycan-binding protein n=1 Tax=Lysobacter antibioticus TaxID=84531 RepID=UPI000A89AE3E|nr:peptidoglycan-binding protein [Lysobacter antibioticus]
MTETLSADEAIALLRGNPSQYATPQELRELAAQVDADSSGRLTVLYSGPAAKDIWSTDVINAMRAAGEDVRVINGSQAADFLESRDFKHAVAVAHGLPDPEPLITGNYRGPATDWLYHPTEGPWADASGRFADKTIGEVRAIVSDAQPTRVFGAIEVPHVLANQNVTTIEGIPREVLVAHQSTHGDQAAFEMIVARARENVSQLRVAFDDSGVPLRGESRVILMDSRAYFSGTQIEGKTPAFTEISRPLAESMNPPTEYVLAGQKHISDWQAQLAQSERAAEAARAGPGRRIGTAVGLGLAASVLDATASADRASTLLSQDNLSAAQSELTHYTARGTGGWIGGASAGLVATAAATGPGVVGFIVIGGAAVAGAHVGEHVATVLDSYETYTHTLKGVTWHSNGRQWVREDFGDLIDDGKNLPTKQDFSADPETADALNYHASISATELAIGKLPTPRNPYAQPAAENDPVSMRRADWERDPQTGAWERKVIVGFEQAGVPIVRVDPASAERAAQLEQASQQVIQENIANGPAPMAARFQVVHRSEGWERFGGVPPSIQSALQHDSLTASDGKLYQRTAEGQWQRNGESVVAAGNLRHELDSTRAALQPQLAQHQEQVAAIPPRQPPTLEDIERKDLMSTYLDHGVKPSPEQLEAALEAVRRTQQELGVNPLTTSLHLELNADKKFSIDSPIQHIRRDADGANRPQAVTSPLEVQMAMLDLRSPPPTAPEAPELRIANLSPQQREALEQVVRQANRLGLQRDDVQATARQAVANATDAVPDIVTNTLDAAQLQPAPKPEALREVDAPSPVIAKAAVAVAEPVVEKKQEKLSEQKRTEPGREPPGTLDGVQQTATVAPLAVVTPPPIREAENVQAFAEPGLPSAPKQAEPETVAVAPAEPPKPDVVVAKPPEQKTPAPQPAPDAPTPAPAPAPAPAQPAPHLAPVAAEATPTPDTPTPAPAQPFPQGAPVAAEAEPAPDDGTLRRGDRGDDVEMLQFRLQRIGYGGSPAAPLQRNGQFDAATEQAVRQLQRDHGLPESGSVDPETVQALAIAQHAKIESRKTENAAVESPATEKTAKPIELAAVANGERTVETTAASLTSPLSDARPTEIGRRVEPSNAPNEDPSKERERPLAQVGDKATPAPAMDAQDLARMSPADQAMFAKIRTGAPGHISDETVAAAMLAAKQNEIHDAGGIKLVAAANGKLWVETHTPGFHTGVSLSEPPPAMQDTLRETQAVNQQREQQLAQEASRRNPDDPSRGPSR